MLSSAFAYCSAIAVYKHFAARAYVVLSSAFAYCSAIAVYKHFAARAYVVHQLSLRFQLANRCVQHYTTPDAALSSFRFCFSGKMLRLRRFFAVHIGVLLRQLLLQLQPAPLHIIGRQHGLERHLLQLALFDSGK